MEEDIEQAVKKYTGKVPDEEGIMAKHLKKGGPSIVPTFVHPPTENHKGRQNPRSFQVRLENAHPKERGECYPSNYRGISITSLLGKALEHVILDKIQTKLPQTQLQFGFTEGLSPTMAAICLTEVITEANINKTPLIVMTLDTEKAFDRACHPILF